MGIQDKIPPGHNPPDKIPPVVGKNTETVETTGL